MRLPKKVSRRCLKARSVSGYSSRDENRFKGEHVLLGKRRRELMGVRERQSRKREMFPT